MGIAFRKVFEAVLWSGLICLVLSGCDMLSAPPSPELPVKKKAAPKEQEARSFAVIYATADPVFGKVTENAEAAAGKLGARIIVKAPDEANVEQQVRMMENMIKQHVDGIAISPVDADALTPYIDRAAEAGIPVVCFDNDAPRSKRIAYLGIDNYEAGRSIAAYAADLLKGHGMILAETGRASFANVQERINGFRDALSLNPDIQLLELRTSGDTSDQAIANLESMIDAHPHFDAFVGLDSMAGSAAVMVWKAKGLYQYAFTWNSLPELLEGIKNGQLTATLSQHEEQWGGEMIAMLNEARDGKPIPSMNKVGTLMITKENLKEWQRQANP
jgi:ribose transport system substrate-binding protein